MRMGIGLVGRAGSRSPCAMRAPDLSAAELRARLDAEQRGLEERRTRAEEAYRVGGLSGEEYLARQAELGACLHRLRLALYDVDNALAREESVRSLRSRRMER